MTVHPVLSRRSVVIRSLNSGVGSSRVPVRTCGGEQALRNEYKDAFLEKHGVKLGFMSAFVKGAAEALEAYPAVNGVIEGDNILYRDYVDVSIAVGTPKGLVVPVLRSVDQMGFAQIEKVRGLIDRRCGRVRGGRVA